jgi:hypothetical protein
VATLGMYINDFAFFSVPVTELVWIGILTYVKDLELLEVRDANLKRRYTLPIESFEVMSAFAGPMAPVSLSQHQTPRSAPFCFPPYADPLSPSFFFGRMVRHDVKSSEHETR